mmetsp:Transcript_5878/g.13681  ORF Transcript_5878/g.13681 Transcript_5878/m.13681 type:complete len:345 (+) Transcript_5878:574-1608(+)
MARTILSASGHVLLHRPLCHHDDHAALDCEHGVDVVVDVLQARHRHLGHEHEVDEVGGEGGVRGDEARVTPHELDDAHALGARCRLDPAVTDNGRGRCDGRVKAEGLIHEEHVVVDGLGHPHHAHVELLPPRLLEEQVAGELRAVASDDEEHVDPLRAQRVADLLGVKPAAPRLEDTAALHVYLAHRLWLERHPLVHIRLGEAVVTGGHPPYFTLAAVAPHAVVVPQAVGDAFDDAVEAGAQPAARDHGSVHRLRIPPDELRRVGTHAALCQRVVARRRLGVVAQDGPLDDLVRVEEVHPGELLRHRVLHRLLSAARPGRPHKVRVGVALPRRERVARQVARAL